MGIDAVVLEQDPELGGTWARRYDRLHLHTVRQFSGLAHFPIPRRYPAYLSRDDVVEYLREYARHFGLRVVTCATVRRIRPRGASSERWTVEAVDGDVWHARVVVIATGQYRQPILPAWPGRESYGGRIAHSAAYTNATPYIGQRVLVVGAGNSGAEIATDLSDHGAASVAISVRTAPPIVPRDPFGIHPAVYPANLFEVIQDDAGMDLLASMPLALFCVTAVAEHSQIFSERTATVSEVNEEVKKRGNRLS
jgi:cation diffusion facilitator CzcD-associated flavoprotein CzcO